MTATDVEDVTGVPVFATVDVSPIVARTIDAGLLVARLHHLDEFNALRRWTTRQLNPPPPPPRPPPASPHGPLTAVKDRHRLSTCAKAQVKGRSAGRIPVPACA